MQTTTMRLSLFCWAIFTLSFCSLHAQCDASKLINESMTKLDDYNFLKSYKLIDPQPISKEFSFVFSKGTSYRIMLCMEEDRKKSNVEITILDRSRKVIASNAESRGKKKYVLQFKCDASGIYYMRYDFKDETAFCGASVLAFNR